jgi:hypothetical protein
MRPMTDEAPAPQDPEAQPKPVRGEALETDEGTEVPSQQPTGPGNRQGGGEWPDPHAPPQPPAPGAVDDAQPG